MVGRDSTVFGNVGPCQGAVSAKVFQGEGSKSMVDTVERDPRVHGRLRGRSLSHFWRSAHFRVVSAELPSVHEVVREERSFV